jgi:hypothetical protein
MDTTTYGRLTRSELITELLTITGMLSTRCRELGSVTADYNREFYPAYFVAPGNSVSAKEREANYKCITLLNEMVELEAEIKSLEIIKHLIETILPHAAE